MKHAPLTPLPEGRKFPGRETAFGVLSFTKIEGKAPAGENFIRYLIRLPEWEVEKLQKINRLFRRCAELFFNTSLEEAKKSAAPLFARLEWEPVREGETLGFDLYYDLAPFEERQKKFFRRILLSENGDILLTKKTTSSPPKAAKKKKHRSRLGGKFRGLFRKKAPEPHSEI